VSKGVEGKFFDDRNHKICIVADDILGQAFGVTAFSLCQIRSVHFLFVPTLFSIKHKIFWEIGRKNLKQAKKQ